MQLFIDDLKKELVFKTSRSGGKGGQHVNKVATKVEVIFNIEQSSLFSLDQKERLMDKLSGKLDGEGNLHIICQADRSQLANKEQAVEKLQKVLEKALVVLKARKPTKVPKSVILKRLSDKQVVSGKKERRKKPEIE